MRDKEIRSILIAYLQTFGRNLRIYQEKSIGASICDVMAVTDRLTGYEIKSDCDNYARLEAQIKNYDNFFDRNYLVVSDGHLSSAEDKVPDHWGILCIRKAEIRMVRKARDNRRVSRKRQLSILWKLELKNLLTKNDLPLYAQKPKSFLIEKLAEQVDYFLLGKQIAEELLQRDYSVYQATDHTLSLSSDAPFPTELVDTLSEQDPAAFTLDKWIDLYRLAQEARREKEALCTAREMERTPHEIPYTEIEASLGAPWIEPRIVNDFLHHILAIPNYRHYVHYEPITGNWHISEKPYLSEYANAYTKYGTPQYPAPRLLEATLNLREIKVYIKIEKTAQYDEAGTLAALEKQKELQEEFTRWLWLDEDRRWQVEAAYNKLFNGLKKQTFDGSGLTFPEMNPAVSLYDYQKNAVMRITSTPNTLLAFDVGAGKTYIMIAAAMKMRREGLSEKNLFVVPNNIVGQWEQCFTTLYPRAKGLTVEPKSFKPEMRAKVLRQIQQGGYDGIIIAYSCFEMIPLSSDFLETQLREKLDQLDAAVNKLRFRNDWGAAPLERLKKELQAAANELLLCCDQPVDELTFDRLEINTLFLDEAHNYKNIPIRTHLHNVNGINTKGSAKCRDMMLKVQCVQQQNGGRGAVFATGTPLCNSISDVYALQMYLQYEELKARKLDVFDQWVKTFAKPERLCEIDVDTASYRFVTRFSRFYNLPELSALFAQVADFHATEPAGLPDFKGYTNVVIEKNQPLTAYMQALCARTEKIRAGEVKRERDNMLKISTDGRKAALDLRLVGEAQPYDRRSKLFRCVESVWALYQEYPGCSQLVFCDYSTPKGEQFNVYRELKSALIRQGIPEKEIAFIHSYQTEQRKLSLFAKVNAGEIRILLGSTFKLGIGANVQTVLKAIHHLDVPWRPADMVQREGRILRQGNRNEEVFIYRYVAEGSFDSYSWQILETKQRFISQFLKGSPYRRTAEDLESNVLTYAEVKAIALSKPLMKQLAELENERRSLQIVGRKQQEALALLAEQKKKLEQDRLRQQQRVEATVINAEFLSGYSFQAVKDEVLKKIDFLDRAFLYGGQNSSKTALTFRIFLPEQQDPEKPFVYLSRRLMQTDPQTKETTFEYSTRYLLKLDGDLAANQRKLIRFFRNFKPLLEKERSGLEKTEQALQKCAGQRATPDPHQARLLRCEREIAELRLKLTQDEVLSN